MLYNKYIDHTLLKPDATEEQIRKLCQDALEYDFIEVLIQKREEIDTQFIYLLRRAVVTDNIELAKMVQSLRPQLQAYAVIGLYEDGVRGEVISHG